MKTRDFDYYLPPELIAQAPAEPRDHSRLLVLHRSSASVEHRHFYDLPQMLEPGDLLVVNDSRVVPARLVGRRPTGGRVDLLLVRRQAPLVWDCLARPGRRLRPGTVVNFDGTSISAQIEATTLQGTTRVAFSQEFPLEQLGQVALPPYIRQPLADPERYQTVYAHREGPGLSPAEGSLAAPTAGLHFTPELLEGLRLRGIEVAMLTLHIGPATFLPVRVEDPREHGMLPEYCELSEAAACAVATAQAHGHRVVAVGTSVVRTLEAAALRGSMGSPPKGKSSARPELVEGRLAPFTGWNDLLVLPGHRFRAVDTLITNFHLPRSTNLMLVAAFAGWDRVKAAYAQAIAQGYRFYSLGDGMLIL
ncbi:MAG: tRNA preQ1(34) S-adenosylmethionine ribosyltransferase-isomerase QueA [Chloroflexi bacterium]|nr:tRNA preQ1(34) S-adenosylmethionine ribosyltransferase-isomerase QueA [Chloroflexota bacterium]